MSNIPTHIHLHRKSATLEIAWRDGESHHLPAEYLRVHSPSAEVRGHGKGQEVLQTGKRQVQITGIEQVGNYALKLNFNDGHNTGIYSWDYLAELASKQNDLWQQYLNKLAAAGESRDALPPGTQTVRIIDPNHG
ncbi:MAG: gamma-butyrobetaine hydroxylase-like domain-containing protein [Pseudohongiellaceae bacterium]